MRYAKTAVIIVLLAMIAGQCLQMADGERDSLHVQLTTDMKEYRVGDTITVDLHVFEKGEYMDADDIVVQVQAYWHDPPENLTAEHVSTGHYRFSHIVEDGDAYANFIVSVDRGQDHETAFLEIDVTHNELMVDIFFQNQKYLTTAPGQEVTAEVLLHYKGNAVNADGWREVALEGPDDYYKNCSAELASTGEYRVTFTMPDADEDGEYALVVHPEYANLHTYMEAPLYLNVFSVWYRQLSVTGNTVTCYFGVSDWDGMGVANANVFLDLNNPVQGTTGTNGTALVTIPNAYNDQHIHGWVTADGKNQSISGVLVLEDEGLDPAHHRFDVLYAGDETDGIYDAGQEITRKYRAFNDTVPLQNKDIHYYIVFQDVTVDKTMFSGMDYSTLFEGYSEVIAHGTAKSNDLGNFFITVTSPERQGVLHYFFESGMPMHGYNYNPNSHPHYDHDDDLVYEDGNGYYSGPEDGVFVTTTPIWDDTSIGISTTEVLLGDSTTVTLDLGKTLEKDDIVFASWYVGELDSPATLGEFTDLEWTYWTQAGNLIQFKPGTSPGIYKGELNLPEFLSENDTITIMAGYVDEDGPHMANSVVEVGSTVKDTGDKEEESEDDSGSYLWIIAIVVVIAIVAIVLFIIMRDRI